MSEVSILQMLEDESTVSPVIAFERVGTTERTQMGGLSVIGVNKHLFISVQATSDYNVQPQSSSDIWKVGQAQESEIGRGTGRRSGSRPYRHHLRG